ncbi:hypothetical protein LguiB_011937 [Lonicera macranthoides]
MFHPSAALIAKVGLLEMKKSPLPVQNIPGNARKMCGKEALVKLLRWHFGHSEFRGRQLEAIEAVLSGRDCFCLMPTGGGKSMCYQIPALAKTGIVLVVSPLIALMENQVMALKEKGIAAEFLSSTQNSQVRNKIQVFATILQNSYVETLSYIINTFVMYVVSMYPPVLLSYKMPVNLVIMVQVSEFLYLVSWNQIHEDLESGKPSLRLLYVTPELIATPGFMLKLTKMHARGLLNLIAIDEVTSHLSAIKSKPSYRKLASLRNRLPNIPILALTATAVPKVQKDVMESLCLQDPLVLKSSFNRPNIYYEVRYKDLVENPYVDLGNLLKSSGNVCAIVYCLERTTCDDLAAHLSKIDISCAAYHAGLNNKLRSSVLDDWISSKTQVVVATGIDRKDVRIVCHFNIPKSMESFYQESGRAGRDQLPSRSVLYYGMDDRKKMEFILHNAGNRKSQSSNLQDRPSKKSLADFKLMVEYCEESGCRRKKILENFGEQVPASLCGKSCDTCKHPDLVAKCLEELTAAFSFRHQNGSSRIYISSSSNLIDEEGCSEFWNRDDEASGSEEDISDADDGSDAVKSLAQSSLRSKSRLNEKIELLQCAEEKYYHNKIPDQQNAISETLRESSKQRLLNAVQQTKQRLNSLRIDSETSVTFLENECYKKYGKSGKSFYLSQMASTVRWLSTANSVELTNRLGITKYPIFPNTVSRESSSSAPNAISRETSSPAPTETSEKNISSSVGSETYSSSIQSTCEVTKLPPIPSFSEFMSNRNSKDNWLSKSKKQSPNTGEKNPEKRSRLW